MYVDRRAGLAGCCLGATRVYVTHADDPAGSPCPPEYPDCVNSGVLDPARFPGYCGDQRQFANISELFSYVQANSETARRAATLQEAMAICAPAITAPPPMQIATTQPLPPAGPSGPGAPVTTGVSTPTIITVPGGGAYYELPPPAEPAPAEAGIGWLPIVAVGGVLLAMAAGRRR